MTDSPTPPPLSDEAAAPSAPPPPRRAPVRTAVRGAGFAALTATMLPLMAAHRALAPEPARRDVRETWVRRWSGSLLDLFGVDVDARDEAGAALDRVAPLGPRGGRLVVSNHRSALDIGLLLSRLGGTMVSRADLAGWPLVGAAARSVGTVFVDRSSARSGAAALRAVQGALEAGEQVVVFPEGTTFAGDAVRPFHAGAFAAAIRARVPVVPVGLAYATGSGAAFVGETFPAHLARMAASPGTRAALVVGAPLAVRAGERPRAQELADLARRSVTALVARARALADAAPR